MPRKQAAELTLYFFRFAPLQVNEATHAANVETAYSAGAVRVINPEEDPAVAHVYATLGDPSSATQRLHTQYHRVEKTIVPQLESW